MPQAAKKRKPSESSNTSKAPKRARPQEADAPPKRARSPKESPAPTKRARPAPNKSDAPTQEPATKTKARPPQKESTKSTKTPPPKGPPKPEPAKTRHAPPRYEEAAPKEQGPARTHKPPPKKAGNQPPPKAPYKAPPKPAPHSMADTLPDAPLRKNKPTKGPSPRSFLTTHQRWLRLDRWLTLFAIFATLASVGGVYGVNRWASAHGARELHPLHIGQFIDRAGAFFSYVAWKGGPPAKPPSLGYEKEILAAALHAGLTPHLIKAMIQKNSDFRVQHVSRDGAIGLMQVTPSMARAVQHQDNLFLPASNLRAGAAYLRQILQQTTLADALRHYRQASCPSCSKQNALVVKRDYAEHILDLSRRYARDPGQQIRRQAQANRVAKKAPPKKRLFSFRSLTRMPRRKKRKRRKRRIIKKKKRKRRAYRSFEG